MGEASHLRTGNQVSTIPKNSGLQNSLSTQIILRQFNTTRQFSKFNIMVAISKSLAGSRTNAPQIQDLVKLRNQCSHQSQVTTELPQSPNRTKNIKMWSKIL